MIGAIIQDVRFGLRSLRRHLGFTTVAVLTLMLGVGMNSAVFSIVNAIVLKPLPVSEPGRLAMVWTEFAKQDLFRNGVSEPELIDLRQQSRAFEQLAAYYESPQVLTGLAEPQQVLGASVSANFFATLGVSAQLGRAFLPTDDRPGGGGVVVLSHGAWQRRFGSDASVLGRTVTIDGMQHVVVGIMPKEFQIPAKVELWKPLVFDPANQVPRGTHFLGVVGRLRDGTTMAQAQLEMDALAGRLQSQYPDAYDASSGWGIRVVSFTEDIIGTVKPVLWILFGAGGLVLLLACANLIHLQIVRVRQRAGAFAVRTVIGANPGRLARQVITESMIVAVIGGALGLLVGYWAVQALIALAPADIPRLDEVQLDLGVVGFGLGMAVLAGLACGIVPAIKCARVDLQSVLREDATTRVTSGPGGRRLRNILAISEVALALVVLIGSGLLLENFWRLKQVKPGFDPTNVLTMQIGLPPTTYEAEERRIEFSQRLLERVRVLPGVQSVGLISMLPFSGMDFTGGFSVEGHQPSAAEADYEAARRMSSPGYFAALGIPLVEGRDFTDRDVADAPGVVIIDRAMAKRFWPTESAVGKRVKRGSATSDRPWLTVVGVVGDVKHERLDVDSRVHMYFPYTQYAPEIVSLVVRPAAGRAADLAPAVRAQVREIDRDLPVSNVQPMDEWLASSLSKLRFAMLLLLVFGGVALALATVGVYGVMLNSVVERTQEIAVRFCVGASPVQVRRQLMVAGVVLALVGVGVGTMAAAFLTPILRSQVAGVTGASPVTFVMAAIPLLLAAVAAIYMPSRRVTRVDPMQLLRAP